MTPGLPLASRRTLRLRGTDTCSAAAHALAAAAHASADASLVHAGRAPPRASPSPRAAHAARGRERVTGRENHPVGVRSYRRVLRELKVDPGVTLGRTTLAHEGPRLAGDGRGVDREQRDPLVHRLHQARLFSGRHRSALHADVVPRPRYFRRRQRSIPPAPLSRRSMKAAAPSRTGRRAPSKRTATVLRPGRVTWYPPRGSLKGGAIVRTK